MLIESIQSWLDWNLLGPLGVNGTDVEFFTEAFGLIIIFDQKILLRVDVLHLDVSFCKID